MINVFPSSDFLVPFESCLSSEFLGGSSLYPIHEHIVLESDSEIFFKFNKELNSYQHNTVIQACIYVLSCLTRVFSGTCLDYAAYRAKNLSVLLGKISKLAESESVDIQDLHVSLFKKSVKEMNESNCHSPGSARLINEMNEQIKKIERFKESLIEQPKTLFLKPSCQIPAPQKAAPQSIVEGAHEEVEFLSFTKARPYDDCHIFCVELLRRVAVATVGTAAVFVAVQIVTAEPREPSEPVDLTRYPWLMQPFRNFSNNLP